MSAPSTSAAPDAPKFRASIIRLFNGDEGLADLALRSFGPKLVEQAPQLGDGGGDGAEVLERGESGGQSVLSISSVPRHTFEECIDGVARRAKPRSLILHGNALGFKCLDCLDGGSPGRLKLLGRGLAQRFHRLVQRCQKACRHARMADALFGNIDHPLLFGKLGQSSSPCAEGAGMERGGSDATTRPCNPTGRA